MNAKKKIPDLSDRIKRRYPEFEERWNKLIKDVGIDLVNYLKEKLNVEYNFLKDITQFKLKIVIDNNIIFGQIKGAIKKQKSIEDSFLFKLLLSNSVHMFAPHQLEQELTEKINTLIHEDDRELAISYSTILLRKIEIKDAQWTDNWRKASRLIRETDEDDISYLALAFEIGSHGILSFDEVFHKQGEVKVWKHADADHVVTNYNSGFLSVILMDQSGQVLWKIISVVFKFFRDLFMTIIGVLVQLAKGVIVAIAKLPPIILIGLAALGIIFWEDIKAMGKEFWSAIREKAKEVIQQLMVVIKEMTDLLHKIINLAKLGTTIAFEFLGFLINEYQRLLDQIVELNKNQELPSLHTPAPSLGATKSDGAVGISEANAIDLAEKHLIARSLKLF